jgi:predicted deacylase
MNPLYDFTWHAPEHVLEVHLTGMWALEDVHTYYAKIQSYVDAHAAEGFALLVDLSDQPVQGAAVADAMQAGITRLRDEVKFTRAGVVLSQKVVAQLQAKRISGGSAITAGMYADRDSAWEALTQVAS